MSGNGIIQESRPSTPNLESQVPNSRHNPLGLLRQARPLFLLAPLKQEHSTFPAQESPLEQLTCTKRPRRAELVERFGVRGAGSPRPRLIPPIPRLLLLSRCLMGCPRTGGRRQQLRPAPAAGARLGGGN